MTATAVPGTTWTLTLDSDASLYTLQTLYGISACPAGTAAVINVSPRPAFEMVQAGSLAPLATLVKAASSITVVGVDPTLTSFIAALNSALVTA